MGEFNKMSLNPKKVARAKKTQHKSVAQYIFLVSALLVLTSATFTVISLLLLNGPWSSLRSKHSDLSYGLVLHAESLPPPDEKITLPLATPTVINTWYGIRSVSTDDMQTVADHLGGTVISMNFRTQTADQINAQLDLIQSLGYRAIVIMYTRETCSRRPWEWNGHEWVFPQSTVETLQGIAHHPSLFAIYALHEPFDITNECHWTVEQQQELYQLLKDYTDGSPIWSDIGTLAGWEERGIELTDEICDYCGTFHHRFRSNWTSEQCLEETLSAIDADLDTQQRLMPDSHIVFQIQTFSYAEHSYPLRLPTEKELATVQNHLCELHQPMMYYPWSHGTYDSTLKDAPQLWPVIAERCSYTIYLPLLLAYKK